MKRFIIFAAALICLMLLSGCDMIKKYVKPADKADAPSAVYEGAKAEYIKSDNTSLTVRITNDSESTWQSGNMCNYELQMLKDDVWYRVEQIGEFANTMELMIIVPGENFEHTFEFENRYGILIEGHYRVVKSFWANKTDRQEEGSFDLIVEFDVFTK